MEEYKYPRWFVAHTIITLEEYGSKKGVYLVNAKTYAEVERKVTKKALSSGTCTFFLIENIREIVLCENIITRETEALKHFLCEFYLTNEKVIMAGLLPFQGYVCINAEDEGLAKDEARFFCKRKFKRSIIEISNIEELTEIID